MGNCGNEEEGENGTTQHCWLWHFLYIVFHVLQWWHFINFSSDQWNCYLLVGGRIIWLRKWGQQGWCDWEWGLSFYEYSIKAHSSHYRMLWLGMGTTTSAWTLVAESAGNVREGLEPLDTSDTSATLGWIHQARCIHRGNKHFEDDYNSLWTLGRNSL